MYFKSKLTKTSKPYRKNRERVYRTYTQPLRFVYIAYVVDYNMPCSCRTMRYVGASGVFIIIIAEDCAR